MPVSSILKNFHLSCLNNFNEINVTDSWHMQLLYVERVIGVVEGGSRGSEEPLLGV